MKTGRRRQDRNERETREEERKRYTEQGKERPLSWDGQVVYEEDKKGFVRQVELHLKGTL